MCVGGGAVKAATRMRSEACPRVSFRAVCDSLVIHMQNGMRIYNFLM